MEPLDPGQTPGAIYTGEPLPEPTPQLPDAARKPTLAGAEAMTEHVFALYNFAYATGDGTLLAAAGTSTCNSCRSIAATVKKNRENGTRVDGGHLSVVDQVSGWSVKGEEATVTADVVQSAVTVKDKNGATIENGAGGKREITAVLQWDAGSWKVAALKAKKADS